MPRARANRLIHQASTYLKQHAHNPVDWHPWGDEALELARRDDRPILLSIGYSACHWCHVMERESFENEEIARLMNERFVNIKVDREERPDLDEIYMAAVQALTGGGGWPLTVFLTPELKPFFGGTYFPPEDRPGLPGFGRVLQAVHQHYLRHRDQVERQAAQLTEILRRNAIPAASRSPVDDEVLDEAFGRFRDGFDPEYGGFGTAPKFPAPLGLSFLMRYYRRTGRDEALSMAVFTLKKMAEGGIHDHLGGGFHRYSTDARWLVPHFEKMLYDNALLAAAYLEAFQLTGRASFLEIAEETLGYVRREMERPEGGFYSTQDADSEGGEGAYYAWGPGEVEAVLGRKAARRFMRCHGVTPGGNFAAGKSVLHAPHEMPELARLLKVDEDEFLRVLAEGRARLLKARSKRAKPGRDEKVLVSWNGLMIGALARAFQVTGEEDYLRSAQRAAEFILDRLVEGERLRHAWQDGRALQHAFQDDYAALINGLIDLYEAGLNPRFLRAGRELTERMIALFWDDGKGSFFYTAADSPDLIVRPASFLDGATPSGNSLAALALLRLAALTGKSDFREKAERIFASFAPVLRRAPTAGAQMLSALAFARAGTWQIALIGPPEARRPLQQAAQTIFLPDKVIAGGDPASGWAEAVEAAPILAGKGLPAAGKARAHVCRGTTCLPPVDTPRDLLALLKAAGDGATRSASPAGQE